MSTTTSTKYHFKFLDHYDKADREIFFGRDRDIEALYEMVKMSKLALVYGLSGTGKTSLVRCGLASKFSENNWFPVFVRRGNNLNDSLHLALKERAIEPITAAMRLPEAIESLYLDYYVPVYLIFDQFEELFILGDKAEQVDFFTNLAELYRSKVSTKIIIVVREEYLGYFSDFEKNLPSLFENRFRVERMSQSQLEEVVRGTITAPRFGIRLDQPESTVSAILDNIRDERREIDLTNLQMYLDRLWRTEQLRHTEQETPCFDLELVNQVGKLPGVLSLFLDEQLEDLGTQFGESRKGVPLEVLTQFVTNDGTKQSLTAKQLLTLLAPVKDVTDADVRTCLAEFTQRKILRELKQGNEVRYEVAHDLLAKQVFARFSAEETARRKADSIYKIYKEIGRSRTLTKEDLETLMEYVRVLPPDEELKEFIALGRLAVRQEEEAERVRLEEELKRQQELLHAKEKQQKLRNRMSIAFGIFGVAMFLLAAWGWTQYQAAREAKRQLAQQGFQDVVKICKAFKQNGNYPEALQQLEVAENFANELDPTRLDTVNMLRQKWNDTWILVREADTLAARGELQPALENYEKAQKISPDDRVKSIIQQTTKEIDREFEKSKSAGDAMLRAGELKRALGSYQRAAKLKPNDENIRKKLKDVEGKLKVNF